MGFNPLFATGITPASGGANFGAVGQSILPATTDTYDLGSTSKTWKNEFFGQLSIEETRNSQWWGGNVTQITLNENSLNNVIWFGTKDHAIPNPTSAEELMFGTGYNVGNAGGATTNTGEMDLFTGNADGTAGTGGIFIFTGNTLGTGATGNMQIETGASTGTAGTSGTINIDTGSTSGTGNSGDIGIGTGFTGGTGSSGSFTFITGSATGSAGNSGGMLLQTGDSSSGGQTGSITLQTGSTSGALGRINLQSGDGIKLITQGTRPSADSFHRGTLWISQGGTGVADVLYLCIKDATNSYVWKTVTLA